MLELNSRTPSGPIETRWTRHQFESKLVNPANRRKFNVIVVGTGLAGSGASAALGELGYNVKTFCIQDSPRRAHSIAAQGGINAAKNYQSDGDSIFRLFYDTIKGGDFRARESNVYRLAETSVKIIDHCVALGVPFAREYGGYLANRSFGGAQVSRTFYARGQTGQQLLVGAYQSMMRQVAAGRVQLFPRHEMLELVVVDGKARGIITRNLLTGSVDVHMADAVLLATGGYGNVFYLSTNAKASNATAIMRAYRKGAGMANPCFTQIHPTCIPVSGDHQSKLTLMSESLRNDGRVWVPKISGDKRAPSEIPATERDYFLERIYPSFGNLAPRDVSSRAAKLVCDEGRGVGPTGLSVYLDLADAIRRDGKDLVSQKYGNLIQMYERITGEDPYKAPMRIYPAVHYTMGGLWVDYNLMSTIPGLFVLGEANFSDHGANRLGASALMQGLADGFFVAPTSVANYLGNTQLSSITETHESIREAKEFVAKSTQTLLKSQGEKTADDFHRALGKIMWEDCGMARSKESLLHALGEIPKLRDEFSGNLRVSGSGNTLNEELEKAARVSDFIELGELMCRDALAREESCGGHFRVEHQTSEHEAQRDDERFCHAAVWEYVGAGKTPMRHAEALSFEHVKLATRSYK